MPFLDFTRLLSEQRYGPIGMHNGRQLSNCNSQLMWIRNRGGDVFVDEIFRIEEADVMMERLQCVLGIQGSLPQENISTERDVDMSSYYSIASARQNVADAYSDDFEAFGYPLDGIP